MQYELRTELGCGHDVQHMLEQLNLTQYASALQEGGYDDLESMISDFQDNTEELKAELVNDVGMKKPHSRKLDDGDDGDNRDDGDDGDDRDSRTH